MTDRDARILDLKRRLEDLREQQVRILTLSDQARLREQIKEIIDELRDLGVDAP